MARRCSCSGGGSCAQTETCGVQAAEEMAMSHYGFSVTDDASCAAGRQLCQTNRILDSINDILGQILLELQRQNAAEER